MIFEDFRKAFFDQISFTSNQVKAWHPGFDKNNLGRWTKKGYLIKLRNGYYTFKEHISKQNIHLYLANRIYRPSYISLHTALAFHGLIPEAVTQTTSVSTLKTARFSNTTGIYSYKNIKTTLYFGFEQLPYLKERSISMATLEKALIDLLYLYPFYNTIKELQELRLNEDILVETFHSERFLSFLDRTQSGVLKKRAKLLLNVYNIH